MTSKEISPSHATTSAGSTLEVNHTTRGKLYPLTLDARSYDSKPSNYETTLMTTRMQKRGMSWHSAAEICEALRRGRTFAGGFFEPVKDPIGRRKETGNGWGRFLGQQLFGLDFDPETGGAHLLDVVSRRALDERLSLVCVYPTFSATPENTRFRFVIDAGTIVTDEQKARRMILMLLELFPEADTNCKNPNRLFYGAPGEVWETWRCWGDLLGGTKR